MIMIYGMNGFILEEENLFFTSINNRRLQFNVRGTHHIYIFQHYYMLYMIKFFDYFT